MKRSGWSVAATLFASTLAVGAVAEDYDTAADDTSTAVAADDSMAAAANENEDATKRAGTSSQTSGTSQTQMDTNENTGSNDPQKMPVVVLVPVAFASDNALADGCWVRLYDSDNFKGNALTLVGSMVVPSTSAATVTGFEFGRNYGSVVVGPNAVLNVWDNENYRDKTARFQPGQRVPDLDNRMGFFEEIKSMQVTCSK